MEYIIIGLLVLIIILVTVSLFKNINERNITDRLSKLEVDVTKELGEFKNDINRNVNEDIKKYNYKKYSYYYNNV